MARKADIKICRYAKCKHAEKKINISEDLFVVDGRKYYHQECFDALEREEASEAKLKADIQLIKNMWIENISDTVVFSQLYIEINRLVRERGIESEYVIYVLDYCIKNKMNLRYPAGLKYYIDNEEIKSSYEKTKIRKIIEKADFSVHETTDTAPKFTINKKTGGFSNILRGKR